MANPSKENSQFADENGKPLIGSQQAVIADAKVDYATPDLDTEAEIIVAINAANTKINSILDVLEAHGLMADA